MGEDADNKPGSCVHMQSCEMYALFQHSGTLGAWQALYCTGQFENCARYKKTAMGHPVEPNLMPNGTLLKVQRK